MTDMPHKKIAISLPSETIRLLDKIKIKEDRESRSNTINHIIRTYYTCRKKHPDPIYEKVREKIEQL